MTDVAGTGFVVLDRVYVDGKRSFESLGGSCGNVLWSLAKLGRRVAPILRLGNDAVGVALAEELKDAQADTDYVFLHEDVASPVIVQLTDTRQGTHSFSFHSQETGEALPRYVAVGARELVASNAVLDECRIFYTDRMSESIVTAMEVISNRGGIVVFEPSSLGEKSLFDRAVHCATIVKFSGERLGGELLPLISEGDAFGIMTHGAGGLEIVRHGDSIWSAAIANTDVSDTSGSGDMVTVGLLDRLLDVAEDARSLTLECVLDGVARGQRLAAANCSFVGARGLFLEKGAVHARRALSAHGIDADL